MSYAFPPAPQAVLPVVGSDKQFPIHRIYCVGRNYADHIVEMGGDPDRSEPFFFTKPSDAVWTQDAPIPFPPRTDNLHHEMELVVAIGKGGSDIAVGDALHHVFGYAAGVDLTRRDLQAEAKEHRRPWDMAKGFDNSAPMSPLAAASDIGHPERARIWLNVNGTIRQDGDLGQQIWKVPEMVANLSSYVLLQPGDLIMTGTPAGVGSLQPGDAISGGIDGIGTVEFSLGPRASS